MAWIESHQELGRHPKTKRLARLLNCSLPAAIGHLQYLWWWSLDFAQDGDLSSYQADELADAALWDGDPGTLIRALTQAGFLDAGPVLHDWDQYAGRLVEQRQANAARQRAFRERHKPAPVPVIPDHTAPEEHNDNVTVMSPSRNGATVQYTTVHNRESDNTPPGNGDITVTPPDSDWDAIPSARHSALSRIDSPAVAEGERGSKPRRVALPADWALTPDRSVWAQTHCPHVIAPDTATAKFAAHYRTRPDRRTLAEWDSEWQKWLLGDESRALEKAAERGVKAPTAGFQENPHTRDYLRMVEARNARRDAKIATIRAQRAGVQ